MIDENFLTLLYESMREKMRTWLIVRQVDISTADDLVQDAFARIWQRRENIRANKDEVIGLLWCILKNLRIDNYRQLNKEIVSGEVEKLSDSNTALAREKSIDKTVILEENIKEIEEILHAIPQELSEAWLLSKKEKLSIKEIACRTGASESLVRVRIYRAKTRLRSALEDLPQEFF